MTFSTRTHFVHVLLGGVAVLSLCKPRRPLLLQLDKLMACICLASSVGKTRHREREPFPRKTVLSMTLISDAKISTLAVLSSLGRPIIRDHVIISNMDD